MQELLIGKIRQILPPTLSVIDEISHVLDISYDAAYRRVNGKTVLSLEESVHLAKHFKLSLNKLYEVGEQNSILADVSPPIQDVDGLEAYFRNSLEQLQPLTKLSSSSITYSAKDIPLFYTLSDSHLTKYKCYVWLKFLDDDGKMSKMSFQEFTEQAPTSLFESARALGDVYNNIDIIEFWNDNTINGNLQQVFYFYEAGLLSREMALTICEDLRQIIHRVERQSIEQSITGTQNQTQYLLYKSDLLTMSNTVMIKTKNQKLFFCPFTVLTYLKVEHIPTCERLDKFFAKQMKNSKLLINAGERDRTQFFNKMHLKIKTIEDRLKVNEDLIYF
ncbi:helix-turn-helix domain-containing protein [Nonlabens xiamenensis]|uniref:hypothetical protein n=1 Tax=Nonlabens xiamenensis TaxID=2341043 RepID=UPI000F60C2B6|nr:hypothetical protein [Nonlabens xiamenensis]